MFTYAGRWHTLNKLVPELCTCVRQSATGFFWFKFLHVNRTQLYSSTETVRHVTRTMQRDWPESCFGAWNCDELAPNFSCKFLLAVSWACVAGHCVCHIEPTQLCNGLRALINRQPCVRENVIVVLITHRRLIVPHQTIVTANQPRAGPGRLEPCLSAACVQWFIASTLIILHTITRTQTRVWPAHKQT